MGLEIPDDLRVIAVDWSGAAGGGSKKIWIAEVVSGRLVRLESGRSRDQVCQYLLSEAETGHPLLAGLDFAFSFPRWYLDQRGFCSAAELWECSAGEGESWLGNCAPPFWGRPGKKRPQGADGFRDTERAVGRSGRGTPKSVFQIGGAGAVGTGSIRGLPILLRLQQGGYSIWPFHPPTFPMLVEIYPRTFTGPIRKRLAEERLKLGIRFRLTGEQLNQVESSEDALDAAISALQMDRFKQSLALLPDPSENQRLEGIIWDPDGPPAPGSS
jgi:hypothetical protein